MKTLLSISLLLTIIYSCGTSEENTETTVNDSGLPYIGMHELEITENDGVKDTNKIYHVVPPFSLMAQDSSTITNQLVKGKIHIANFFFTSCPSICPAMIAQMQRLQQNTLDIDELIFLSHTIDPKRDTIPKLRAYIEDKNIDTQNWYFLYGDKQYVHDLGIDGYMVNAMEDDQAEGGFLHSEHFVLIDREGHIRGLYSGIDTQQVDQLEKDIRNLIKTEYAN